MIWLLVGLFLAFLLLIMLNWWAKAEVKTAKNTLLWGVILLCVLLGLMLLAAGRGVLAIAPAGYAIFRMFGPTILRHVIGRASAKHFGGREANNRRQAPKMDRREALDILGLDESATSDQIQAAYRKLMSQYHPDKGGSDWMAAKLNEARRVLLNE